MSRFRYEALNSQQQIVSGELTAANATDAIADLAAKGMVVRSISAIDSDPQPTAEVTEPSPERTGGVAGVERSVLESHLSTVLKRAQELIPAFRAYAAELSSGRQKRQFLAMLKVIEQGDTTRAMQELANGPEYWVSLLSASSASQDPTRVFQEFLNQSQRSIQLRRNRWLALAYPSLVAAITIGVLTALSLYVIPVFHDIFREFALKLSPLTMLVLNVAQFISSGQIWIAVGVIAIVVITIKFVARRSLPESFRIRIDDWFGTPLMRANANARFAGFAADLLEAGLDVPGALRVGGFCIQSARMRRGAWRLASELETSGSSDARNTALTSALTHALLADMATNSRVKLLRELSQCYDAKAIVATTWNRGLIEPIAICLIGLLVGATVLAMFMPLISLIHGLSG